MSVLLGPRTLERLARLEVAARRGVAGGGRTGERGAGAAGVGSIFLEHRSYSPGDDLRYVDWNAYGRLRSLHVKVFEKEENLDVHLIVDRTSSMGSGPGSKLELACKLAGMVGASALAKGDQVRLHAVPRSADGAAASRVRGFRGRASTGALMEALANVRACVDAPLDPSLREMLSRLGRRRGFALLVTDFLAPEGRWKGAVDFLSYRRVDLTCLHVVSQEERNPTVRGPLRLEDVETGGAVDVDVDEATLAEYRRRFERWLRAVDAYLRSKEARHLVVDAGRSTEPVLLRSLLRAGVLR